MEVTTNTAPDADHVPIKTWLTVIGATLGAFMAVLNIQIVNAVKAIRAVQLWPIRP